MQNAGKVMDVADYFWKLALYALFCGRLDRHYSGWGVSIWNARSGRDQFSDMGLLCLTQDRHRRPFPCIVGKIFFLGKCLHRRSDYDPCFPGRNFIFSTSYKHASSSTPEQMPHVIWFKQRYIRRFGVSIPIPKRRRRLPIAGWKKTSWRILVG